MSRNTIASVILRRPSASHIGILGIGDFDERGLRDVTRWVQRFTIAPGGGDVVNVLADVNGDDRRILTTSRLGTEPPKDATPQERAACYRTDDELRMLALADWARSNGALFEALELQPADPPKDAKPEVKAQLQAAAIRLHDIAERAGLAATLVLPAPEKKPEKPAAASAAKEK